MSPLSPGLKCAGAATEVITHFAGPAEGAASAAAVIHATSGGWGRLGKAAVHARVIYVVGFVGVALDQSRAGREERVFARFVVVEVEGRVGAGARGEEVDAAAFPFF